MKLLIKGKERKIYFRKDDTSYYKSNNEQTDVTYLFKKSGKVLKKKYEKLLISEKNTISIHDKFNKILGGLITQNAFKISIENPKSSNFKELLGIYKKICAMYIISVRIIEILDNDIKNHIFEADLKKNIKKKFNDIITVIINHKFIINHEINNDNNKTIENINYCFLVIKINNIDNIDKFISTANKNQFYNNSFKKLIKAFLFNLFKNIDNINKFKSIIADLQQNLNNDDFNIKIAFNKENNIEKIHIILCGIYIIINTLIELYENENELFTENKVIIDLYTKINEIMSSNRMIPINNDFLNSDIIDKPKYNEINRIYCLNIINNKNPNVINTILYNDFVKNQLSNYLQIKNDMKKTNLKDKINNILENFHLILKE